MGAENPSTSLYHKLVEVMKRSKRIPKNGFNAFHKYAYATEADVAEHIREILAEVGIAHTFTTTAVERDEIEGKDGKINFLTRVWCEFTLYDMDTGDSVVSRVSGEALDSGDKGLYKAITGANKYFLMKTFLIPTGDDPETVGAGDGGAGRSTGRTHSRPPVKEQPQQQEARTVTQRMLSRLFAIANENGVDHDVIKKTMLDMFNKSSTKDLTYDEYKRLVAWIETPLA